MPVDAGWIPPSGSSAPDYIGCLSQMSNSFLSSEDAASAAVVAPPAVAAAPARQNSGGDHAASLPPTPVGSQLSGSQICTPLDGQSLHPRTPSDSVVPLSGALTPQESHRLSTDSAGRAAGLVAGPAAGDGAPATGDRESPTDRTDNVNPADAVDTSTLPLLGGSDANVAEALEVSCSTMTI